MKLQEAPDLVPVGELPRHLVMFGDRYAGETFSLSSPMLTT